MKTFFLVLAFAATSLPALSQQNMPGVDMSGGSDSAMTSMEHHHLDMGPHMKMTDLRTPQPGDEQRAEQIVEQARQALEPYKDYHRALADGFKIFAPNLPSKMKHFTNYGYAMEAASSFNPAHPTSLLYEKDGAGYKLIGAMYTAPRTFSEEQLNARVPLSVAQWHEHVNFCLPPQGRGREMFEKNPQFGFFGSIATEDACHDAGGRFVPHLFGWMVHFYPWERTPEQIWSVERQKVAPAN